MTKFNFDAKNFNGYMRGLLSLNDVETFMEMLPSAQQEGYDEIISRLLSIINSELELNSELFEQAKSIEDIKYVKSQIKRLRKKRDAIDSLISYNVAQRNSDLENTYFESLQKQETDNPKTKNIIFLRSAAGGYFAERDVKSIPYETREDLIGLIEGLETYDIAVFSRSDKSRNFVNDEKLSGLCEAKSWKLRVIYETLPPDIIIIVAIVYKNQDRPAKLREFLETRMMNAKPIIKQLTNNILTDPEKKQKLIEENEEFKQKFIEGLSLGRKAL